MKVKLELVWVISWVDRLSSTSWDWSGPETGQVVSYLQAFPHAALSSKKDLHFHCPRKAIPHLEQHFPPFVSDRENYFSSIITKAVIAGLHVNLFLSLTLECQYKLQNGRKTTSFWLLKVLSALSTIHTQHIIGTQACV